jgi:hypothetical protein
MKKEEKKKLSQIEKDQGGVCYSNCMEKKKKRNKR